MKSRERTGWNAHQGAPGTGSRGRLVTQRRPRRVRGSSDFMCPGSRPPPQTLEPRPQRLGLWGGNLGRREREKRRRRTLNGGLCSRTQGFCLLGLTLAPATPTQHPLLTHRAWYLLQEGPSVAFFKDCSEERSTQPQTASPCPRPFPPFPA